MGLAAIDALSSFRVCNTCLLPSSVCSSVCVASLLLRCVRHTHGALASWACHVYMVLQQHLMTSAMPMQVSVVSVGLDKGVFIWDIRKDTPVRVIPDAHLHETTCVAINRAGTLIATGAADCAVKLWDFSSGKPVGMYAGGQLHC